MSEFLLNCPVSPALNNDQHSKATGYPTQNCSPFPCDKSHQHGPDDLTMLMILKYFYVGWFCVPSSLGTPSLNKKSKRKD